MTSMTRDFIVGTVTEAPSMVSVTVLCAATANPPAKVSASNVAPTRSRSMGERASWSLFKVFKTWSIPDYRARAAGLLRSQDGNEKA
jgi:hypothetical protein